jgi:N-acetylglucosaminyldiphosphoundecaprenol N-acetyl-beta-D-mannosaminyltransferase
MTESAVQEVAQLRNPLPVKGIGRVEENARARCERANVLGVQISAVDMGLAVRLAEQWIDSGRPGYACLTGVHGVMEARRDPAFLEILNGAALNLPDGMPMSWMGWLQGFARMDRVFGPDFMAALCALSIRRGYRNFFYGGQPGVADRLSIELRSRFPGLQVAGTFTPPFRSLNRDEESEFLHRVRRARPHILWVGLSTPKQEKFMAQYVNRLRVPLVVGVGAAFDFHSGRLRDCPSWMKRAGMQWLHRLAQDPRRLWKRYLFNNSAFLWHVALEYARLRLRPADGVASLRDFRFRRRIPASESKPAS